MYNTTFTILYDSDEMLFYTKIGLLEAKKGICPLHYTIWGATKTECKERAIELSEWLNKEKMIMDIAK